MQINVLTKNILGMLEEEAHEYVYEHGGRIRVFRRDSDVFGIDHSYDSRRINIVVEKGIIIAVSVG